MGRLDFGAYLADDRLPLDNVPSPKHPDGITYYVPSPSAMFTLQLRRMMQLWGERGTDTAPSKEDIADLAELTSDEQGEPIDFQRKLLGTAYDELLRDGVSGEALQRITNVVMAYYGVGEHVAKAIISSPGEAEARPNRATRRAAAKPKAGSGSPKASGAMTGSGRGTTSRTSRSSTSPRKPAAGAQQAAV